MRLRAKLLKLLEDRRISRTEVAAKTGIAYSTFRTYLDDPPRMPSADTGVMVARALGVPSDWLFDDAQEWPPPERPTLAGLTDQAVTEDLIRRRTQAIEDIRLLTLRLLEPGRLARFEARLSTPGEVPFAQLDHAVKAEFKASHLDIQQLKHAWRRLEMLNPVKLGPSTAGIQSIEELLSPFPRLAADAAENRRPFNPFDETGAMDPVARIVPVSGGLGEIIDRLQYAKLSVFQQKFYVPVVPDFSEPPPAERPLSIHEGQTPPERFKEFLRYDIASPAAFALRLAGHATSDPRFEPGLIVVCDPIADIAADTSCVVVLSDRPDDWRISAGAALLKERPELRTAKGRERLSAMVFLIAGRVANA